jgi:hypothetical protein
MQPGVRLDGPSRGVGRRSDAGRGARGSAANYIAAHPQDEFGALVVVRQEAPARGYLPDRGRTWVSLEAPTNSVLLIPYLGQRRSGMPKQTCSTCVKLSPALIGLVVGAFVSVTSVRSHDMASMEGHMYLTSPRPLQPGDQDKARATIAAAKAAMAPYEDYRKALADGYQIFLPDVPQPQYHFTNYRAAIDARSHFDATKPTSLLYSKTPDGGYRLVGVMYTDAVGAEESELNERIPLSIARWHQHINFCKAPADQKALYFGSKAKFGLLGSITTQQDCESAGGTFYKHIFGWMVHVYPNETDPTRIWSVDDDDQGHDNMDHAAMPGMKMN